jgi:hypothetical protein
MKAREGPQELRRGLPAVNTYLHAVVDVPQLGTENLNQGIGVAHIERLLSFLLPVLFSLHAFMS